VERVQESRPDADGRNSECRFREAGLFSSPPLWRIKTARLLPVGSEFKPRKRPLDRISSSCGVLANSSAFELVDNLPQVRKKPV
jgi:hypothetical protein